MCICSIRGGAHRHLVIRLFDLFLGGLLGDAQDGVVVPPRLGWLLRRPTTKAATAATTATAPAPAPEMEVAAERVAATAATEALAAASSSPAKRMATARRLGLATGAEWVAASAHVAARAC